MTDFLIVSLVLAAGLTLLWQRSTINRLQALLASGQAQYAEQEQQSAMYIQKLNSDIREREILLDRLYFVLEDCDKECAFPEGSGDCSLKNNVGVALRNTLVIKEEWLKGNSRKEGANHGAHSDRKLMWNN